MEHVDFVEIVPPLAPEKAEAEFNEWLRASGLDEATLDPDDVRIDTIRAHGGRTLRRYLVRRLFLRDRD